MARLFLFAIGGTGARVVKSLTMLLAAGVKPDSATDFEIVPMMIDPHDSNLDLIRTQELLQEYQNITREIGIGNGFFGTQISTLNNIVANQGNLSADFTFPLQNVSNTRYRDYIGHTTQSTATASLVDVLFSGKTIDRRGQEIDLLDIEMDIGFIGNPNIGSVVLNQIKDSPQFIEFASNYRSEDRIFIISSIFGGTGAAGFPIILKNIRDAINNSRINSRGFLENAKIGAITVLPYFNVAADENSPIQKSEFIAKTKAALYYYQNSITGSNLLNALYYIADDFNGIPYENDPGNNGQRNNAHFIELAAALSIINFLEIPDNQLRTANGEAIEPIYKEFWTQDIRDDSAELLFSNLELPTRQRIEKRLSQFAFFKKYIDENIRSSIGLQPWSRNTPIIDLNFLQQPFYHTHLHRVLNAFSLWLAEMQINSRSFSPFQLHPNNVLSQNIRANAQNVSVFQLNTIECFIKERTIDGKITYYDFNECLSKTEKNKNYQSSPQKLIKLSFDATNNFLTNKYGIA